MLTRLAGSTAVLMLISTNGAFAENRTLGCALVDGVLPEGCYQANEGQVVSREVGANTESDGSTPLGDLGFSISIDSVKPDDARSTIAGDRVAQGDTRDVDRMFDALGIQMSYDGLGAKPQLNVSTADMRRSYAAGDPVTFRAYSNYPSWVQRAEVRLRDKSGKITTLPIKPNGSVDWVMPASGDSEMEYSLRVYDSAGRYDETAVLPLSRSATHLADPEMSGAIVAAGEGVDRTARRTIPVRGGAVTVSGLGVPSGANVTVMGENVVVDGQNGFVMQRILPPGDHGVRIGVGGDSQTRAVTIPTKEVFATGIVDITLGRDLVTDENWDRGRLAGFVDGVLADGTRITASVDTREDELQSLFRDLGRKHPYQVLRGIEGKDVWVTTGDDSSAEELAPTSGKLYAKVERDGNFLSWGDFKPVEDLSHVVRSDRALYGLMGGWHSSEVLPNGEARLRFSGYAAQPDSLVQRDSLRGTGGSAYFLSRRDIQSGSETLLIEVRDPVSGRVISLRRLVEGQDYRIDYVQGVVILSSPLSPSAGSSDLIGDNPLGDFDVNLVAQYEYVPTTGDVSGVATGGRGEVWLSNGVRVGISAAKETTGIADNTLVGADVLLRRSEGTFLSLEVARSEGPGFGTTTSLNGGLELDPTVASAGALGTKATGVRVEGRADLADFGAEGYIAGYFDERGAGFTSPDLSIDTAQTTFGAEGKVQVSSRAAVTFGADSFKDDALKKRVDLRLGLAFDLNEATNIAVEASTTDRTTAGSTLAEDNGKRTELGAKLTWAKTADTSLWVFGKATLQHSGGIGRNDRLGIGGQTRISEAITATGEISGGSTGTAASAQLAWAPNANTSYTLGYRLDPLRAQETSGLTGSDLGTLVFGSQSRVNDKLSYTSESTYSALGSQPSLTRSFGVTYTPSEVWRYEFGLLTGDDTESDGTKVDRRGLSFGLNYSEGDKYSAGLRTELRFEDSNNEARAADRRSLLLAGNFERKTSDDWRMLGDLNAVYSDADTDNLLDGRYVEAKLGYAYRPVKNDRINALVSYTYLYDMPGADQVNIDGDTDGDKQRSHILNVAASYDLNELYTIGVKYGLRYRQQADRSSDTFTSSVTQLGIVRLDYHVVHNWDIMAEGRAMAYSNSSVNEFGGVIGVYRDFGDNLRFGGGYALGGVSDDLRSIEKDKEGVFLNLISKF